MSTIGYQLNILRDTQMVQRRLLEKQFPYIDWARMPFSSYGDFFRLRGILDDCGAVWTNAYGRSNDEADGQRNFLEDYSGNGRDIELFNFGYSRQSGYNGYVQDFRKWGVNSYSSGTKTESTASIQNNEATFGFLCDINNYINKEWKIYIECDEDANPKFLLVNQQSGSETTVQQQVPLNANGVTTIPAFETVDGSTSAVISWAVHKKSSFSQIAPYKGAIVGDGVDDYGQCVKDFALPDDYTVVAMRELLNAGPSGIINKTRATGEGAFIFEYGGSQSYSYGDNYSGLTPPKLFSYQTKASYNGTVLTPGTGADTADDKLLIFRLRDGTSNYISAALYSFGIFTRTLTKEELRIVENCMYAEWIAMTGKLEDIEYYDILDARFRSNEEDADKRNRWVGRLGKLHMTLNNYGYSQMSGWNGYPLPRAKEFSVSKNNSNFWFGYMRAPEAVKTKSWGIKIISNPTGDTISLIYLSSSNTIVKNIQLQENVVNIIPPMTEDFANLAFSLPSHPVGSVVTFEQLPIYGGALVSDGVDDYAVSDEVIDEEIGGVVMLAEKISDPATSYGNIFSSSVGLGGSAGKEIAGLVSKGSDSIIMGDPWTSFGKNEDAAYGLDRSPIAPNNKLMVGNNNSNEWGNVAFYQLRLIKNQPTDVQLEAIKWQCRKEHDDYLIHMGWKEVE